jgi:hypothetical protein
LLLIPENALVDVGQRVTTQEEAGDLPTALEASSRLTINNSSRNSSVASGYIQLYDGGVGYKSVIEAGPNPSTSFITEQTEPQIG